MTATRDHIAGKPITGRNYVPSCGRCDVPPWESCACSEKATTEPVVAPPKEA